MDSELKPKKNVPKWAWILAIVIVICFVIGISNSNKSIPPPKGSEITAPSIKISAVQLSQEYNDNQVSADQSYKGKLIEVSGIIDSIGKDILDEPYVTLKGIETSFFGIQCMFNKSKEDKLANLVKGQTITLTGKVSGELIGNVIVRDCDL